MRGMIAVAFLLPLSPVFAVTTYYFDCQFSEGIDVTQEGVSMSVEAGTRFSIFYGDGLYPDEIIRDSQEIYLKREVQISFGEPNLPGLISLSGSDDGATSEFPMIYDRELREFADLADIDRMGTEVTTIICNRTSGLY